MGILLSNLSLKTIIACVAADAKIYHNDVCSSRISSLEWIDGIEG